MNLPKDVYVEIVKHVKIRELPYCAQVSKLLNSICLETIEIRDIQKKRVGIVFTGMAESSLRLLLPSLSDFHLNFFVDDDLTDLYELLLFERVYSHLKFRLHNGTELEFRPKDKNRSMEFISMFPFLKLSFCDEIHVTMDLTSTFTISEFCRKCGIFDSPESDDIGSLIKCSKCELTHCEICVEPKECWKCSSNFCYTCSKSGIMFKCDKCVNRFCTSCMSKIHCDACGQKFCDYCHNLDICQGCRSQLCSFHMSDCSNCDDAYCSSCIEDHLCPTCHEMKYGSDSD